MVVSHGICPNCGTPRDNQIAICSRCGQKLLIITEESKDRQFNSHDGAADLYEPALHSSMGRIQLFIAVLLSVSMVAGLTLLMFPSSIDSLKNQIMAEAPLVTTNTPRPTFGLPTVTSGPATATPSITPLPSATNTATATPEPCLRQVTSNDTLYGLAASCGHTSFDVLQIIVELNELADANSIVQGQTLIIPWPTEVETATVTNLPQGANSQDNESTEIAQADSPISAFDEGFDPFDIPTPTLLPGIQFHTVVSGETMISIAQLYFANASLLSQLNPEIEFNGCDFGAKYGGPRCVVNLAEEQLIRVPAPTPTPTLSPTASGSETPTPSPTPTVNTPSLQAPSDRALFRRNELVTLRWIPTGTLNSNEVYRVQVEDLKNGEIYLADTTDTFYILPEEWQADDAERHEYLWHISIIPQDNPASPSFITESRTFTWEGRGEGN